MFSQIKDRKHNEHNFHSVAGVMPQGWDLGVLGGSKTLVWGFAMAPHQLRLLFQLCQMGLLVPVLSKDKWFLLKDTTQERW